MASAAWLWAKTSGCSLERYSVMLDGVEPLAAMLALFSRLRISSALIGRSPIQTLKTRGGSGNSPLGEGSGMSRGSSTSRSRALRVAMRSQLLTSAPGVVSIMPVSTGRYRRLSSNVHCWVKESLSMMRKAFSLRS